MQFHWKMFLRRFGIRNHRLLFLLQERKRTNSRKTIILQEIVLCFCADRGSQFSDLIGDSSSHGGLINTSNSIKVFSTFN